MKDYHEKALKGRGEEDLISLYKMIRKRRKWMLKHLELGALTFEFPEWLITMYSRRDYVKVFELLKSQPSRKTEAGLIS